jgi:hypothetical protein
MKQLHRGLEALVGLALLLAWLTIAMLADEALVQGSVPPPAAAASAATPEPGRLA